MDRDTLELAVGFVLAIAGLVPFLLALVEVVTVGPFVALVAVALVAAGVVLIGVSDRGRPV